MSMLLAQGTGRAVGPGLADGLRPADPGRHAGPRTPTTTGRRRPCSPTPDAPAAVGEPCAVRHGDQMLGVLRLQERPGLALTSVEERLFTGLAAQAGLVLRLVGLRAELEDRRAELLARAEELKASRERLIETQDAERRRLERDIHDGAQQHLVALAVNLRLAQIVAARSPTRAAAGARRAGRCGAARDRDPLLAVAAGSIPRLLSDEGLVAGPAVGGGGQPDPGHRRGRRRRTAPAPRRGRPLLLLHGGGAERRQALRRRPGDGAAERGPRSAGGSSSPTTGRASTRPRAGTRRRRRPDEHAGPARLGRRDAHRRIAAGRRYDGHRAGRAACRPSASRLPAAEMRARIAWALVGADDAGRRPGHRLHRGSPPADERGDVGGPRLAAGPAGGAGLRADGRAHRLALPQAPARLAAVRGEPAVGDAGRRGLQRLGARGDGPGSAYWAHVVGVGGTAARLAGVHRADHGLPHRPGRAPALAALALGRLGRRSVGPRPAHPGDADDPPRRVRRTASSTATGRSR